ncbi:TrbI/VirB10 family protein [Calothrix sp. CCY 0018]|uniref:TrbI/VirB10 family protein n=1 Tax=Calothrix sp. CCY 0018 TaxID=3103864 RepID=UPI0039C65664
MTKNSTSLRDNETGLTEWETRMAKLVGLDESTPADMENESLTDSNARSQPDEPNNSATQQPLSANPFAKAGLVGAGTLAVVMFAGGFLSQMMSNDKPNLAQNTIRSQTPPKPQTKPRVEQLQEEVEGLKTKLALSEQLDAVKAAQQELRMTKPTPSTPPIAAKPTSEAKPRTIPRDISISRIRPQPQPPQIRIVEVPKIVQVDRVVNVPQSKPQPKKVSKPVVQKPKPIPVLPQIVPRPEPPAFIPQQPLVEIAPPPEPNPMQEWARLAKLGSYGQVSFGENGSVSNRTSPQRVEVARKVEQKEPQAKPETKKPTRTARESTRRNSKTIPMGSSAKAELATPIYGETSRSRREENEDNNVYVVSLKQSLKAADGTAALPTGSQIYAKIDSISENGLMQLEIVKIKTRENGEIVEKTVPQNALMIRGKQGKPLIAKQYRNNGSSIARNDALSFALGGVGKAAELINRTESEVVTGENGTIAVTNVNRDPSLAAGILEGGIKTVVPQITRRNQRAASEMSRKTNIWYLPEGKEVEVFVNQETRI